MNANDIFALKMPNADTFESKLRHAEAELGISPGNGIPVVYLREK